MPQAAVAIIGQFIIGAIGASGWTLVAKVFAYVAASYLLNRASAALTPKQRSKGLGSGNPDNYYDAVAP